MHGASPGRDEKYSRKSLVAHYLPSHLGQLYASRPWVDMKYRDYAGVRFYRSEPEYSLLNHLVYDLKAKLRGRDRSKAL